MTYVEAEKQNGISIHLNLELLVIYMADYGRSKNNRAQGFLWEKYTTSPFVKQNKCKFIGEVVTPWPCFVIVASEKNQKAIQERILFEMIQIVCKSRKTQKRPGSNRKIILEISS